MKGKAIFDSDFFFRYVWAKVVSLGVLIWLAGGWKAVGLGLLWEKLALGVQNLLPVWRYRWGA